MARHARAWPALRSPGADDHDEAGQSTYCYACGARVIGRDGYEITAWHLTPDGAWDPVARPAPVHSKSGPAPGVNAACRCPWAASRPRTELRSPSADLVEQRLGLLQISGIEALGEPAVACYNPRPKEGISDSDEVEGCDASEVR